MIFELQNDITASLLKRCRWQRSQKKCFNDYEKGNHRCLNNRGEQLRISSNLPQKPFSLIVGCVARVRREILFFPRELCKSLRRIRWACQSSSTRALPKSERNALRPPRKEFHCEPQEFTSNWRLLNNNDFAVLSGNDCINEMLSSYKISCHIDSCRVAEASSSFSWKSSGNFNFI